MKKLFFLLCVLGYASAGAQNVVTSTSGAPLIASGTWTPTFTSVANVSSSTAYQCQYLRVGNVVNASCRVDITPAIISTTTQLGISLPVASSLSNSYELQGTCGFPNSGAVPASIYADGTNDRAQLQFFSPGIIGIPMSCVFTYLAI